MVLAWIGEEIKRALALCALAAPLRISALGWDSAAHARTLVLKAQGSFFAGGQLTRIRHSAFGGTRPGTIWDGGPPTGPGRPSCCGPAAATSAPASRLLRTGARDGTRSSCAPANQHGILGISPMMMLDRNNVQIAE